MVRFNYPFYPFQWYKNGNPVSGNAGQFNYKVLRSGDKLNAWWWLGPWCMENTKEVHHAAFPFDEAGVSAAKAWLEENFAAAPRETVEGRAPVLESEPYYPAADGDGPPF